MEERKFIKLKKEEFGIKEYIKRDLGKGKISRLDIEYTPIGEKIIVHTSRPGLVIGKRGEKIEELTEVLKKRFKLENPHIEIKEIENPLFDAQLVADEIAMALERMGNLKFKVIAYKKLLGIMKAGALGCELRLTGKLPSERARSWRFADGYLKKAGESRKEIDWAQATAITKTGMIGVKVAIMPPNAKLYDRIDIEEVKSKLGVVEEVEKEKPKEKVKAKKAGKKEDNKKKKKVEKDVSKTKKDKEREVEEGDSKASERIEQSSFPEDRLETKNEGDKPKENKTAMKIEQEIKEDVDYINESEEEKTNKSKKLKEVE